MEGLDWQTIQIPFGYGRNGGEDPRQRNPPELAIAKDVEFEEQGGLQTRKPFAGLGADIAGGGTLANLRRPVANGAERLVFTKDALYAWNANASAWVLKATHLAAKVDESSVFVTTDDQVLCDRASLGGVTFYSWHRNVAGVWYGYVAAIDEATGAVVLAPQELTGFERIRLTALTTRVLLSFADGVNGVYCYALDPADPAAALGGSSTTVQTGTGATVYFDVCRVPGADQAVFGIRRNTTTSYDVVTMTAGLVAARLNKARTCDGPIAVSCPPTGTHVQILRANSTAIEGDYLLLSTLADVYTAQAVGTAAGTVNQIAAAHRSVQDSSQYRCYAFWSSAEAAGATDWQSKTNWVDTGGSLGTQATFLRRLGVASRAFDRDGRVFVWMVFAGESSFSGANDTAFRAQLQNSYFLYRDDATLHAKAAFQRAGGFAAVIGCLPGVQNTSGETYAWCGVERRIIKLGGRQSGYGARAPREVLVTFDSDEARRTARLGSTLYVTGGELLQYDGSGLYEVGYHVYPWYFGAIEVGAGNLADGTYAVKVTWRWDNGRGERDRSTTATVGTVTIAGGPNGISIVSWVPLYVTHKTGVAVEVWRTAVNAPDDAPFALVSSLDPAAATNPNRFIPNDPTAATLPTFNDELADADTKDNESLEEGGTLLENLAPPAASIVLASSDRLFLAGVAGDPNRVWYSKQRADGQVAAFHDALTVPVPREGGAITALAFLNETLVVFRETAIYALPGDGIDNGSGGANFGPARTISSDIGAESMEAVAFEPGGLVFHGRKGKYRLNRGWGLDYIGGAVRDYDAEPIRAIHVLEGQHQIRWLTSSRMLVLDYAAATPASPHGQWAEWSIAAGAGACVWSGEHAYLTETAPLVQRDDHTGIDFGLDVETAWIKMADLQGAGRVRRLLILGELRGTCHLRVRIARDYETTYFYDEVWPDVDVDIVDLFTVGGPFQFKVGPTIQRCQAIKVRITVVELTPSEDPEAAPIVGAPTTEAVKLTGIGLEVGVNRGLHRRVPLEHKV